jgi:hypothetical protein
MWDAPEFNPSNYIYTRPPFRNIGVIKRLIKRRNKELCSVNSGEVTHGPIVSRDNLRGLSPEEYSNTLKSDLKDPEYRDKYLTKCNQETK